MWLLSAIRTTRGAEMVSIAIGALAIVLTLIGGLLIAGPNCESVETPDPIPAPRFETDADVEGKARYIAWLSGHGDDVEWAEYHADAMAEYADEFTALFNSYEVKRAKNGRIMVRTGDTGSFKFARTMRYVTTSIDGITTSNWEL